MTGAITREQSRVPAAAEGAAKMGRSPYWRIALGASALGVGLVVASLALPAESRLMESTDVPFSPRARDLVTPAIPHALETPNAASTVRQAPPKQPVKLVVTAAAEPSDEWPDDLAILRMAKRDLTRGAPRAALRDLDDLAAAFPATVFAEEAEALRIEALAATGDVAAARALADRFHVESPASPYAHRVRSLTGR